MDCRRPLAPDRKCLTKSTSTTSTPAANTKEKTVETKFKPFQAEIARIGVDAPRHAEQAGDVHREEGDVEADEHQPECPASEPLRQHPPGDERRPVIERGEDRENHAADQHVMEVRDDEIGVVNLPVVWHGRHHHAGQPADHEDEQKPRMNSIGTRSTGLPSQSVAIQAKTWMPIGIAIAMLAAEKKDSDNQRQPRREHVVHPQPEAEEADRDRRQGDPRVADQRRAGEASAASSRPCRRPAGR